MASQEACEGADAVAIGDTPYDAEAAGKAKIAIIGVFCGGCTEGSLRAGCVKIYPGPSHAVRLLWR
jgi:phosphoglycolate phosphatase-like HAD superfamily hydrolase